MPLLLVVAAADGTVPGRAGYRADIPVCAGILYGDFAQYKG
jgi:hypothetical protein